MTLSRTFQWNAGFTFDLLAGILPALWLLVLNLVLGGSLAFVATLGFQESSLPEVLDNVVGIIGMLLLAAIPLLGAAACLALIGASIVRHRVGGLARLSTKQRNSLCLFLTLGSFLPIPGFLIFGRDNPFGVVMLGQDLPESLGLVGLLLLNAYIYLCPAVMSYRTLRLLKTAGGST